MCRFCFIVAMVLLTASSSFGQLTVTAISPASDAVNVTTTSIDITFSAPLDTTYRTPDNIPVGIMFLIGEVGEEGPTLPTSWSFSPDLRTIHFPITLTQHTFVNIVIFNARSQTGQMMSRPFVSNFTSWSSYGTLSISGNVVFPGHTAYNSVVLVFTRGTQGYAIYRVALCNSGLTTFTVNSLRGQQDYFIVAVNDYNCDGQLGQTDPTGWCDTNGDYEADPIAVDNSNISNITISIHQRLSFTVLERLSSVRTAMATVDSNATIRGIWGGEDIQHATGRCTEWQYNCYSPRYNMMFCVRAESYRCTIDTTDHTNQGGNPNYSLSTNCIDSDSAFRVAERAGGAWVRTQYPISDVVIASGANDPAPHQFNYHVCYNDNSSQFNNYFQVNVDMFTGQVADTIWSRGVSVRLDEAVPTMFSFGSVYPNPFNSSTTISYAIPKSSNVELKLFDLTGREVRTIYSNQNQASGSYRLSFDGKELATGTYFIRLQAGRQAQFQKIVLLK
ncbi:MAG: T9SS type A sorting domain-containing protein [bacterium]|nr:T9SS type A sorting domain-containing protein [bacterium]